MLEPQVINSNSNLNKDKRHSVSKSEDFSRQTILSSTKSQHGPFVNSLNSIIESWIFQTIMSLLTIYILFADDIKILTTDAYADVPFSISYIILMIIFLIELIMSAIAVDNYFLHFFFWLDLISVITILLDIHWFYNFFVNSIAGGKGKQAKSISSIVKAGKSAKVAARAVRVLRVLRIIRLVRVSKLYKAKVKLVKLEEKKMKALKRKLIEEQKLKNQNDKKQEEDDSNSSNENIEELNHDNASVKLNELNKKNEHNLHINKSNNHNINAINHLIAQENIMEEEPDSKFSENKTHSIRLVNHNCQASYNAESSGNEDIPKESKTGKKLSELTSKRVILIVLALVVGIILFNTSFYYQTFTSMDFGIKVFKYFETYNDPDLNMTFNIYIKEHIGLKNPLIFAQVGYLKHGEIEDHGEIRETQKGIYSGECSHLLPKDIENSVCYAIYDERYSSKLSSVLNIVKTLFISVVLALGTYYFNKDTTELVLEPLENMIEKVKLITKNPNEALMKAEKEEIEKIIYEEEMTKEKQKAYCSSCTESHEIENNLETVILEKVIAKIGKLLAMSFGEAGSEIISKNMQKNTNGEINPFIPGKQIFASFCYISIDKFEEITDVLEDKVMIFVNEIAEIIHEIASEYGGNINRSMGNSFLIVWKYDKEFVSREIGKRYSKRLSTLLMSNNNFNILQIERLLSHDDGLFLDESPQVNQMTDLALISYIKIMEKMKHSKILSKYRKDPKLQKYIIDFDIRFNFAFDLGWAIEGPIGSPFKIDATYISPYSKRVTSICKLCPSYGVNIIMSDTFVERLSESARNTLRMIDIVKSDKNDGEKIENEIGFYTLDLDTELLIKETDFSLTNIMETTDISSKRTLIKITKYNKKKNRIKNLQQAKSQTIKKLIWDEFIEDNEDFYIMRSKWTKEFYDLYNEAFDEFQFGDWNKSKEIFEKVLDEYDDDGPSQHLYEIMEKENFEKPKNWEGNKFIY